MKEQTSEPTRPRLAGNRLCPPPRLGFPPPVRGGPGFKTLEVRQRYRPGQTFIFGLTAKEPWQFHPSIPHLPAR